MALLKRESIMHKTKSFLIAGIVLLLIIACGTQNEPEGEAAFPKLSGPYIGQTLPGDEPQLFAPGIISTAMHNRDMAMTPDGNEIYFCVSAFGYNLIFYTKQKDGYWTEPEIASFISDYDYMYYEPHITYDGKHLLFLSDMPSKEGAERNQDIWIVNLEGDSWSEPYNPGKPVNTDGAEFFPSTTKDGTLYFTRAEKGSPLHFIYRSRFVNGKYAEPEKLNKRVNCGTNRYNAFIDPDERFIIVPAMGMEDGFGGTDYYIVFRDKNDNWSKPLNMGAKINTMGGREYSPYTSSDGKFFFFMSSRTKKIETASGAKPSYRKFKEYFNEPQNGNADIYWMRTDFIWRFKPEY